MFLIYSFLRGKKKSFSSKKKSNISSMDSIDDSTQLNEEITLDTKIKIYIKPKKSIHFSYGKKNQKITILGNKTLDGVKWSKIKTKNEEEGWCIL